jgi:nucleotide-binding universal stress UspA family protein
MYQHILVPIDGSATSSKGLDEAIALATLTGGSIRLLHVVDVVPMTIAAQGLDGFHADVIPLLRDSGRAILDAARERVKAEGIAVEAMQREVNVGRVCDAIVEEATKWPADLVVLGTHGRRGFSRMMLGSDAEQVLRCATVPVLLVRGE